MSMNSCDQVSWRCSAGAGVSVTMEGPPRSGERVVQKFGLPDDEIVGHRGGKLLRVTTFSFVNNG